MGEGNGNTVTRAELAAHIKGIDQRFEDVAADVSEIKYGIHGITEELQKLRVQPGVDRQARWRAYAPGIVAAVIAAVVSIPIALVTH